MCFIFCTCLDFLRSFYFLYLIDFQIVLLPYPDTSHFFRKRRENPALRNGQAKQKNLRVMLLTKDPNNSASVNSSVKRQKVKTVDKSLSVYKVYHF